MSPYIQAIHFEEDLSTTVVGSGTGLRSLEKVYTIPIATQTQAKAFIAISGMYLSPINYSYNFLVEVVATTTTSLTIKFSAANGS